MKQQRFNDVEPSRMSSWDPAGRWVHALTTNKLWMTLLGVSGVSATVMMLRRRRRRHQKAATQGFCRGAGQQQTETNGKHPAADDDIDGPIRPPTLSQASSLSDTYAWNAQGVDIGAVLGVDIGGTLSKLVYFEKKAPSDAQSARRPSEADPMGKKVLMC